ncbi:MAG: helix-turn-helix domain-containing protein [Coriobacteriales bacterium]|jgi:AraC family transcriptional regulator of adaptative response / DNA-3-methyladenine glycosylase II|nr:helix-turn-helix domain-containing protein [Coriobacteriales bacterium]
MLADKDILYEELKAHDTRFDGRFFVGVSSTKIYCRPVCKAKLPAKKNCAFFASAAEAESAGYRPCLLCRPDIAPDLSVTDASKNLAKRTARMLKDNCASINGLGDIAEKLGYTDRHIRRTFEDEYHVTPVQFLQTCRLLLAKSLLTDTDLSVAAVARAAGFGSTRRFNDLFKQHYRLCPTKLRKKAAGDKRCDGAITLQLGYRPPYGWDALLAFFEGRAIVGVETVVRDGGAGIRGGGAGTHDAIVDAKSDAKDGLAGGAYMRTARLSDTNGDTHTGWLRVSNVARKNRISLTISDSLLPVLSTVIKRVKRQFDLSSDPDAIYDALCVMNDVRPGLCVKGTRVPGCFDTFEMACRTVLGQQITVKAAGTLAARIAERYGTPVETGIDGLNRIFPTAADMLAMGDKIADNLGALGVTSARSRTIRELAKAFCEDGGAGEVGAFGDTAGDANGDSAKNNVDKIDFDLPVDPVGEMDKLMALHGIGPWSANYMAMRAMGYTDAFLETDFGVKKALPECATPKERLALSEAWRPWRSYATVNLWNSL